MDLSLVTAAGDPTIAEGHYDLFIGGAQPMDTTSGAHSGFDIQGSLRIPE
jgi:hypothetical protein